MHAKTIDKRDNRQETTEKAERVALALTLTFSIFLSSLSTSFLSSSLIYFLLSPYL